MRYYILSFVLTIILSCNSGNKQENLIQSNYVDSENTSSPTDVADSVNVSNENKNSSYSSNPTMSREEDAYEEGRALAEEDRLNKTHSHEGDNFDDDYDDDYDEGYEE